MVEAAIEAGAEDVVSDEDGHTVLCSFESLGTVAAALEAKLGQPSSVKAIWKPTLTTSLDEEKAAEVREAAEEKVAEVKDAAAETARKVTRRSSSAKSGEGDETGETGTPEA